MHVGLWQQQLNTPCKDPDRKFYIWRTPVRPRFPVATRWRRGRCRWGWRLFFAQRYPERQSLFYCLALLFAVVCGLSRVVLGVHYFSDVLAGFAAATLIVALFVMRYAKSMRDF
ncbi:phosphatase PAP2 family protein [Deefgea sp. CFH1-16]|nr:phosphatase PAP2 family protein [Deefgea sp. CFH1-16]MBM5574250.1 phosphatase PAP2 family protein [Deefgea sp. CFH1-16]